MSRSSSLSSSVTASCHKYASDLCCVSFGLASVALFKQSWPTVSLHGIEMTLLLTSGALCSLSIPLLVRNLTVKHLSQETGLLGEKAAHLCLFFSTQGLAFCSILALGRTDLGDHRALAQVSTLITPVLSYYVLDSSLDPRQIFLLPLSFVGVVLLCQPTKIFENGTLEEYMEELYGVFLALGAAAFHSLAAVSLRAVRQTPAFVSISVTSAGGLLVWTTVAVTTGSSFSSCQHGILLMSCVCLLAASVLVRKASWSQTNCLQAGLGCVEVAIAYALQVLFLARVPHWCNGLGALVVGLCAFACVLCQEGTTISRKTPSIGSQFSVATRKISTGTQDVKLEALMSVQLQLGSSYTSKPPMV